MESTIHGVVMMAVWTAALVVSLCVPGCDSHWTSLPSATSSPQLSLPTTFCVPPSIHHDTSPKGIRRHPQQRLPISKISRTSLFALSGSVVNPNGNNKKKGEESRGEPPKQIANSVKRVKNATKSSSRSNKGNATVKNGQKALPKKQKSKGKGPSKSKTTISSSAKKDRESVTVKNKESTPKVTSNDMMYIQFSRVFQRHVIYKCQNINDPNPRGRMAIVQSYEFLDDAVKFFPQAQVLAPTDLPFSPPSCSLVYPDDENNEGNSNNNSHNHLTVSRGRLIDAEVEEDECETTIAGMGLWTLCELEYDGAAASNNGMDIQETNNANIDEEYQHKQAHAALRTLLSLVSSDSSIAVPRHFFRLDPRRIAMRGHTPHSVTLNHARVVSLLSCKRDGEGRSESTTVGLAMDPSDVQFVLQNFPQLCLYDCGELESLVRFLIQPLPPAGSIPSVALVADRGMGGANVDWPSLSGKGYGAGLTIEQATKAIRMMPELLALYYEDSRKPSMVYMYHQMQASIPPKLIEDANIQLNLEGADLSDAYTFGYLRSLGIPWSTLRILTSSLPLWTTSNLEPGWELLQKGPVRSMLKRPALDYLRQRLQIGPWDVYRLLKTHTRLSTYDARNKILPILDKLQSKLELSSAELRKLMMRMPSLMGMGMSAFDDRVDFFMNEADMSIDDLREAVLRQPSLLQYSVGSTLRPKLHFLLDELGISESSISRIIKSAPAIMGNSLTENLRPKVAFIMKMCGLDPHEVGYIISTSPQTLLLSQKSNIEPTLKFLAPTLLLTEPRELGQLMLSAPRILRQGLETSLAKKIEMLTDNNKQKSKEVAVAIIRKNPALLVASNAVLEDRIERCPADEDIATWLLPSNKGRRKIVQQSAKQLVREEPILASLDKVAPFDSLTKIYPSPKFAAQELGVTESAIRRACGNGILVGGNYLYSLADYSLILPKPPKTDAPSPAKTIPISIFCSGCSHPSDSVDVARGQSRTGGLAFQVFTDSSHDHAQFLQQFSIAAESCFGIRVPIEIDHDGSKLIAVFPLVNPSKNRCELKSCCDALRILEALLKSKRNEKETLYDIKVYTDSNYAWKLVKSKERLLELGSYFTSQEMLSHLDMKRHSVNIDILHPLIRSFNRLNGQIEPLESAHRAFDNAKVEFVHSMDGISRNKGGLGYVKSLKRQARSAAMWQFNREGNLV